MLNRQRRSKEATMHMKQCWKHWQLAWLAAKLVNVRQAHAVEALQNQSTNEKEKGKLLRRRKALEAEVSALQGRVAALSEEAAKGSTYAAKAAALESRAKAAEAEEQRLSELRKQLHEVSEQAIGQQLAREAAEKAAAAHKAALERARTVQAEELRGKLFIVCCKSSVLRFVWF